MDAVRAADGRRHLVFEGTPLERGQHPVAAGDEDVGGLRELDVEAGVEHVRRRHALVHEARFGSHQFGEVGQEGDDVVLDLRLDGVDARDVENRRLAFFADDARRLLRDDAEPGHGLGGVRLDLEPDPVALLRRPDRGHFGAGIAGNHEPVLSPDACALAEPGGGRKTAPSLSPSSRGGPKRLVLIRHPGRGPKPGSRDRDPPRIGTGARR